MDIWGRERKYFEKTQKYQTDGCQGTKKKISD